MKELKYHISNKAHLETYLAAEYRKGASEETLKYLRREGMDYLAKRKSENARRKQVERMWDEHILPLQAEKKRIVASLAYPTHNRNNSDPRRIALKAYLKVIDTLLGKMRREATCVPFDDRPTMTPIEYAKAKNVPNNGEHWTDFVPTHIKQRVCQMFDDIPYTPKARRKIPFERVVGVELHELQKDRLIRRTEKELVRCKQDALLNPSDEKLPERIQKIEAALAEIDKLEPSEFVPTTWQGLMSKHRNIIKDWDD
jgi:hypothetical protein